MFFFTLGVSIGFSFCVREGRGGEVFCFRPVLFHFYRPRLLGHPCALPPHMIEQRHVPGRGEGVTFVTLGGGFWEVSSPLLCVLLARQLQS